MWPCPAQTQNCTFYIRGRSKTHEADDSPIFSKILPKWHHAQPRPKTALLSSEIIEKCTRPTTAHFSLQKFISNLAPLAPHVLLFSIVLLILSFPHALQGFVWHLQRAFVACLIKWVHGWVGVAAKAIRDFSPRSVIPP